MQPKTGNTLIIYGHGGTTQYTFSFRRTAASVAVLYAWTREGIAILDRQMQKVANELLLQGTISNGFSNQNKSTIGGTERRDFILEPPVGLNYLPDIPADYVTTDIAALMGTAWHNAPTLAASTRMVFMMEEVAGAVQPQLFFSNVINDPHFSNRPLDILWCACKSDV